MAQVKSTRKKTGTKRSKAKEPTSRAFDRKLPQAPEAEIQLLGSILFDPTLLGRVVEIVRPDDFYVLANKALAQVIWDLWNDNKPIDPGLVFEELRRRKQEATVGGFEGLAKIADSVPEASHAEHYAQIVADRAILRNLITSCQEIIQEACDASEEAGAILDRGENKIYQVAHQSSIVSVPHIGPVLQEVMKVIDETPHGRLVTGLATGYYDLDQLTSGFQDSEMIVLAARPSMGKTTLALNIAEHVALEEKKAVAVFSLETSVQRIARNMLCAHARVDAHKLRTGYIDMEKDYPKLPLAVGVLKEAKIFVDDATMLTPFQLKAKARRLKVQHDIALIIVDYLQLIDSPRGDNRQQEIAIISRQLKALAKELSLPVVAVSQLSRAVEAREGNRPRLSDLRESGAIEQDADVVMLLYRGDYYERDESKHTNIAELNIAKQRNGPTGMVRLRFFKEYLRFEPLSMDVEMPHYEEEPVRSEG